MQVLLQDCKTKKWNISSKGTFIRPTGRSAIIWVPSREKSYLHNRRFICLNPELEFDSEEDGDEQQPPAVVYVTYKWTELQAMQSSVFRTNKNRPWQKEQRNRKLSFSESDAVGPTGQLVKGKWSDG